MALPNLAQDLTFSNDQGVKATGHTHQVPNGIVAGQHKQILPQGRNGEVGAFSEVFRDPGSRLPRIGGGVVDLEAVARRQDGRFGYSAVGADVPRRGVPLGFGNGKLLSYLDSRVMDGETDAVDLQSLRRGLEAFLLFSFRLDMKCVRVCVCVCVGGVLVRFRKGEIENVMLEDDSACVHFAQSVRRKLACLRYVEHNEVELVLK